MRLGGRNFMGESAEHPAEAGNVGKITASYQPPKGPTINEGSMVKPIHPDQHELHDWPMYGPKNPEIANMVERLAYDHGMRVCDIENVILLALQDCLRAAENEGGV